ncbi:MAG: hypothetical protein QOG42_1925 [Solirubrobacteraceae bacterium]|jgi:hypothetical protein|nr:hypothetical protein [Solirubrobacteraceae bacterium]
MMMIRISVPIPMYMALLWCVRAVYPTGLARKRCTDACQWPATVPPSGAIGRFSSCQRCMPPAIE